MDAGHWDFSMDARHCEITETMSYTFMDARHCEITETMSYTFMDTGHWEIMESISYTFMDTGHWEIMETISYTSMDIEHWDPCTLSLLATCCFLAQLLTLICTHCSVTKRPQTKPIKKPRPYATKYQLVDSTAVVGGVVSVGYGRPGQVVPGVKRARSVCPNDDVWTIPAGPHPHFPRMLLYRLLLLILMSSQQTWNIGPTLVYCWANVVDGGPTVNQRWANVSFCWVCRCYCCGCNC